MVVYTCYNCAGPIQVVTRQQTVKRTWVHPQTGELLDMSGTSITTETEVVCIVCQRVQPVLRVEEGKAHLTYRQESKQ